MKIAVFSFTERGTRLAERLCDAFKEMGHTASLRAFGKHTCAVGAEARGSSFREAVGEAFRGCGALIFVGAAGIAVRGIAPFVMDKYADPAVVSVDEFGRFAVPLLSGHVGGANRLAELTAEITGGIPLISTASDLNRVFAVDVWADKHFLTITDRTLAKEVTAALLRGEKVGFISDFPVQGALPEGLIFINKENKREKHPEMAMVRELPVCFYVTYRSGEAVRKQFGQCAGKILRLVPRCLSLGCGCKRDFDPAEAVRRAEEFLEENGIDREAVMEVATIDRKEKEAALRKVAGMFEGVFRLHSAEELAAVPGEFHDSEFVKQTVGVGNVCERAAMRYGSELLVPKTAYDGITFALSVKKPSISF